MLLNGTENIDWTLPALIRLLSIASGETDGEESWSREIFIVVTSSVDATPAVRRPLVAKALVLI